MNTEHITLRHTHTQLTGILKVMLALIISFLYSNVFGQSNFTPVPYNLPNTPFVNTNGYTDPLIGNLTFGSMRCFSANGYGIWASNGTEWFLLGNEIQTEAASSSPSGVVAAGTLLTGTDIAEVKVTSNLKGQVRYVWPDPANRNQFIIKGFNNSDIHIDFSGLPGGSSRNVIRTPINPYPSASTGARPVAISGVNGKESYWEDCFDVAMDTKYLYIVWEVSYNASDGTPLYQIWGLAQNLSNGNIDFGPTRIDGGADIPDPYTTDDFSGRRPTVACDVRNNPAHPTFDAAFISEIPVESDIVVPLGNGKIFHSYVIGGVNPLITVIPMTPKMKKSATTAAETYFRPVHARMLVASYPGNIRATQKGIYGIVYSQGQQINQTVGSLIFHKILNNTVEQPVNTPTPYAWYVDGSDNTAISNLTHEEPQKSTAGTTPSVKNYPIAAFANPYDGEANDYYDEYHCLYTLEGNVITVPLLMVHGIHNGVFGSLKNPTSGSLEQPILNRFRTKNPDGTFTPWHFFIPSSAGVSTPKGFVNQMGIHAYWQQGTSFDYTRDMRSFDEDIEENTLVTGSCLVADGSGHNGTPGAELQSGKTMTLWTDPIFGVGNGNSGVYISNSGLTAGWRNARLTLVGSGVNLSISGLRFVTLPNFEFRFTETNQKLIINAGSVFEYYGLPPYNALPVATNFLGTGTINLAGGSITPGSGEHDAPTDWSTPAILNIHGGANFKLPEGVNFVSTNSFINCMHENSIMPVSDITSIVPDDGIATFHGNATVAYSKITVSSNADIIFLNKPLPGGTAVMSQLFATNSSFLNNLSGGGARIVISGASWERIIGGKLDGIGVKIIDPTQLINISYPVFAHVKTRGIDLSLSSSSIVTDQINIIGNRFTTFDANAEAGIFADGFSTNANFEKLWIEANEFTTNTGQTDPIVFVGAGIHLVNSSGTVLRNTISGTGYKNGVLLEVGSTTPQTNTFLCSNNISNCSVAGLSTQYWKGYSKLNELKLNELGHLSKDNNDGGVDFCYYHDNEGPGLKLSTSSSNINMSGVHHDPNDTHPDYAGWNTFYHNAQVQAGSGEIEFSNQNAELTIGTSSTSSDVWGHNTLIADGTINSIIFYNADNSGTVSRYLNKNYFGTGTISAPTKITITGTGTSTNFHQFQSHYGSGTADFQQNDDPYIIDFIVTCGEGFETIIQKGNNTQAKLSNTNDIDTSEAECDRLKLRIDQLDASGFYKQENDTARHYIETCFNQHGSFHTFVDIDGAVQFMNDNNDRWLDYRDWLKKVLYLNLDTLYYCADVSSIISTFQYMRPGFGVDLSGEIAIIDYLLQNNRCPERIPLLQKVRANARIAQAKNWRDTVKDSTKTPLDTSAVTLESLGLEILRGQPKEVNNFFDSKYGPIISNIHALINPFRSETKIEFNCREAVALQFEVFDILGRKLYGGGKKVYDEGDNILILPGADLPHGELFGRFSASDGTVRTIKLRHK